jgi:hypothetical protein
MSELVIHIGLPKTATTTLQEHVLPLAPLYLGKRQRWSSSTRYAADLSQLCAAMPDRSPEEMSDRVGAWVVAVRREVARRAGSGSTASTPVIISDEGLSRWLSHAGSYTPISQVEGTQQSYYEAALTRTGELPIAQLLRAHLVPAWAPYGAVSVIVTLRDRAALLGSLYAQHSHLMPFASQEDFERQVAAVAAARDAYLCYADSVAALQHAVGDRGAVVVLNHETLSSSSTIDTLARVTAIPTEVLSAALQHRLNRRSVPGQATVWELRGSNPPLGRALEAARAVRSTSWGKRALESESRLAFAARAAFNRLVVDWLIGWGDARRQRLGTASPRRISVGADLAATVATAFASDDERLLLMTDRR